MMAFLVALNTTALVIGFVLRLRREHHVLRRLYRLESIVDAHGDSHVQELNRDLMLAERIGRLEVLTGHAKQIPDFEDEDETELDEVVS